jgi:hypothetical protein
LCNNNSEGSVVAYFKLYLGICLVKLVKTSETARETGNPARIPTEYLQNSKAVYCNYTKLLGPA